MTFPQLMPDTFSRGKRKMQMSVAGWADWAAGEACGASAWTLIKVIQQQQLEHHTRLYYPTQPPSLRLQLTATLPIRRATAGLSTIINASVAHSEQLWSRAACSNSRCGGSIHPPSAGAQTTVVQRVKSDKLCKQKG